MSQQRSASEDIYRLHYINLITSSSLWILVNHAPPAVVMSAPHFQASAGHLSLCCFTKCYSEITGDLTGKLKYSLLDSMTTTPWKYERTWSGCGQHHGVLHKSNINRHTLMEHINCINTSDVQVTSVLLLSCVKPLADFSRVPRISLPNVWAPLWHTLVTSSHIHLKVTGFEN